MKTHGPDRYFTLSRALRERFGVRVHKIPLDAGFGCPNRDGTLGREGCAFCNPQGSGTGLLDRGMDLAAQWHHWRERLRTSRKAELFLAYLQSYSNTYGPAERLARVLERLSGLPDLAGLSIGTRPDCLDHEKLNLLAAFGPPVQLELGLQSSNAETLARIGRGHGPEVFADTARRAHERDIEVVAHLMAGLPGEDEAAFLATADFVAALPVSGVKLHNTLVCRGTRLERWWRAGEYQPPTLAEYARMAALAVARLRPDMVVHRLNADPAPDELLAPDWGADKQAVLAAIRAELDALDITQGSGRKH